VKKHYARKKKPKNRAWRLKRMAREYEEEALATQQTRKQEQEQDRLEQDFEMFLRDVEEDQELRQTLDLYKARLKADQDHEMDEDSGSEDEVPKINMDELLDDFDELTMNEE
jgi:nonsense-mediated mRNA decay protein 3